ncbi:MAG TPA: trypsin-like peptidase domain-containing protein, partial [Propionibacteriaceae bacterium]|nr:trypsin-like peptidase domain-containing protein [Propionibacteriaceae bacterium]
MSTPNGHRLTGRAIGLGLAASLAAGGLGGYVAGNVGVANTCDVVALTRSALPAVVTVFAASASQSGSGSGAITSSDGSIVTNDHVIHTAGASGRITVLLNSGELKEATLVATDPQTDLAVLKIE